MGPKTNGSRECEGPAIASRSILFSCRSSEDPDPPPRENLSRNTCTDCCSRRTRLGRRLGDKDEGILLFWAEQHGQACVRAAHLTREVGPRVTDWPTLEKKNQYFSYHWVSGKSLSRVFCVASARCLYLRRVKRHHQVVKGRDAKTFEKFFEVVPALVPVWRKSYPII